MGMFRLFLIHLVCFYLKVYCVLGNIFRIDFLVIFDSYSLFLSEHILLIMNIIENVIG